MKLPVALIAAAIVALVGADGSAQPAEKKTLAFVVNGASDFWKLAEAGVRKAQAELPAYTLVFKVPEQSTVASQTRLLDNLAANGVAGIVVSPVDAEDMLSSLDRLAGEVALFTTDSDAPTSRRVAYFGSSNLEAGKQAGQLLRQSLPGGGQCVGFVGLSDAANTRGRIEGIKQAITGSKIELVEVLADDFDLSRARRNVEETIATQPNINCMVGFYSYNTPQIYDVLKQAGKLGKIVVVGFDERAETLAGIEQGAIAGTIVQQPFEWGYLSMTAMAGYLEGNRGFIPDNRRIVLPTRIIDRNNIGPFLTELKATSGSLRQPGR